MGASGCGKTTVLSSIVGLKKLDEGTISVFGGIPGESSYGIPGSRVGYMPQVSLFQNIFYFSQFDFTNSFQKTILDVIQHSEA